MQHPIHIHGLRFLVLDQDGKINNNISWKDTILVRTGSTVDILLQARIMAYALPHCRTSRRRHGDCSKSGVTLCSASSVLDNITVNHRARVK